MNKLSTMAKLSRFVSAERFRFETRDNNLFAASFGRVLRYCWFLVLSLERHQKDSTQARISFDVWRTATSGRTGTWRSTPIERALHERMDEAADAVHLDIESFYLFAKVLLDHFARCVESYFGQARGTPIDSHRRLAKDLANYAAAKHLSPPGRRLLRSAQRLHKSIGQFRDKQIVHARDPRLIWGTTLPQDQAGAKMAGSFIYPTAGANAHIESATPAEMLSEIDAYVAKMIYYLRVNRAKTRYTLESKALS